MEIEGVENETQGLVVLDGSGAPLILLDGDSMMDEDLSSYLSTQLTRTLVAQRMRYWAHRIENAR